MKNPGKRGSGSGCGGDAGPWGLAAGLQCTSGLPAGHFLWISPAPGGPAPASGGRDLFSGGVLGLAPYQLCCLPGRYPSGVADWYGVRNFALGRNLRPVAATDIFHNLGLLGAVFPVCPVSFEKNFGNCKNFVCIWGKMGYNKVYKNFQISAKAEKGIPWQKNAPRKSK